MTERPRRIRIVSTTGGPTEQELQAIETALEKMVEEERKSVSTSLWLRAARSQGRRLGMLDYRDRFSQDDAWRLSARFPFGGREYPSLHGRGDSK